MSDIEKELIQPESDEEGDALEPQLLSRRKVLKTLAVLGGAAALSTIPGKWQKPVVKVGTLPAFAQASPTPVLGTGDLQVTLTWNTGGSGSPVDIDNHVVEPGGARVYYAAPTGPTATLDVDNVIGFGPENIFVPAGQAAAGTYRAQVVYYAGSQATVATIRITVFADTPQQQVVTLARNLPAADRFTAVNVADITFPAGTIQEITGTEPLAAAYTASKTN